MNAMRLRKSVKNNQIFPETKFFIIGKSPQKYGKYERELRVMVEQNDLRNIIFIGHRNDVPNVMRTIDVIVHASVEPDPYPNVVIEGMASGCAVIASKLGGPIEMIDDGNTGLLVEPGVPRLLADGISRLLSDGELRKRLGSAAKNSALSRWSIENNVRELEDVYVKILTQQLLGVA